ncbi:ommochrome-binding protein-like [Nymphalis io]|uniref:ommochrome-binding protein-like n=1 Tax=Inachis io TaxID=171585 RepID=UPI0021670581|nr:ommochrome-binding protein-like [Nymphalis io]
MKDSRRAFKIKLKWCQDNEEQIKMDILATSYKNKHFGKFWQQTNRLNARPSPSVEIGDVSGCRNIANMFKTQFKVEPCEVNCTVADSGGIKSTGECLLRFKTSEVVEAIMSKKRRKSPGHDGLSVEHLRHAGVHLPKVLGWFYNICVSHGFLPDSMTRTVVVPIIKIRTGDAADRTNYRPISLATITAKVLDSLLDTQLCKAVNIHDAQFGFRRCYIKETLASLAHSPNQLAFSGVTNTLYFSFDSGRGEYLPVSFNIDTKKLTILKGIKDAFAIASDSANEIYFGGSHGIYKYSPISKSLKRLGVSNLDIWWIQVKAKIYFIKFPSLKLYFYENRKIKSVSQLRNSIVNQFVIDSDDNIFFNNSTGLFGVRNGSNNVVFMKRDPKFYGMALDNTGHVYLCCEDGVYVVGKMLQRVKKILNIQGILGMAFDKDNNLIYSDSHHIVRLKSLSKDDNIFDNNIN